MLAVAAISIPVPWFVALIVFCIVVSCMLIAIMAAASREAEDHLLSHHATSLYVELIADKVDILHDDLYATTQERDNEAKDARARINIQEAEKLKLSAQIDTLSAEIESLTKDKETMEDTIELLEADKYLLAESYIKATNEYAWYRMFVRATYNPPSVPFPRPSADSVASTPSPRSAQNV